MVVQHRVCPCRSGSCQMPSAAVDSITGAHRAAGSVSDLSMAVSGKCCTLTGSASEPKWSATIVRSSLSEKLPISLPVSETTASAEIPFSDMLSIASKADTSGAVHSTCIDRNSKARI